MASDDIVINRDFGVFMAALFEQSQRDYQSTTNTLIMLEKIRAERAETALALARNAIMGMLNGDYMPTSAAIERALFPSWEVVEAVRLASGGSS